MLVLLSIRFESCLFPSAEFDCRENSRFIHSPLSLSLYTSCLSPVRSGTGEKTLRVWPKVRGQLRPCNKSLLLVSARDRRSNTVVLFCHAVRFIPKVLGGFRSHEMGTVIKGTNCWNAVGGTLFWLHWVQQIPVVGELHCFSLPLYGFTAGGSVGFV